MGELSVQLSRAPSPSDHVDLDLSIVFDQVLVKEGRGSIEAHVNVRTILPAGVLQQGVAEWAVPPRTSHSSLWSEG